MNHHYPWRNEQDKGKDCPRSAFSSPSDSTAYPDQNCYNFGLKFSSSKLCNMRHTITHTHTSPHKLKWPKTCEMLHAQEGKHFCDTLLDISKALKFVFEDLLQRRRKRKEKKLPKPAKCHRWPIFILQRLVPDTDKTGWTTALITKGSATMLKWTSPSLNNLLLGFLLLLLKL